jgi:WD40 repeat protein
VSLLKGHTDSVLHLAYDPLGAFLASSSADGSVRLWRTDAAECECVHELKHGYGRTTRRDATRARAARPAPPWFFS